ncbi:DUF6909 family protein [Patulibacter defluvii]|uniref:DUF6909 family protein n=1 Tax=Patulibacter defluvii TaxID=3095358 RepID=UPI002A751590|nr:hypothetical protein [Patulibacter sp. DM4]
MSERVASSAPTGERSHGLSDEVELYHRTYTTLLRSSGETRLRILEPSHRAMGSSLHPLAATDELDLGAFLYAIRRLPDQIAETRLIVLGQEPGQFADAGFDAAGWPEAEAPARRRLWRVGPDETLAVLVASGSDVDDLVPTLVAFQIEWNKVRARLRASGEPQPPTDPERLATVLGGAVDDWQRLRESWGERFGERLRGMPARRCDLRLRTLGTSNVGYARVTRDWWRPVRDALVVEDLHERPVYFVSSNTHSLVNLVTGIADEHRELLLADVERRGPDDLRRELTRIREGRSDGSLENLLYFAARSYFDARPAERLAAEGEAGVLDLAPTGALRIPVQAIAVDRLDPTRLDRRLGAVDAAALRASRAVVVNVDYPLGISAYNILREVAVDVARLRGVYVLGKAATLNADVGDVLISGVVHDEHTRTTYWLDNAFGTEDLQRDLRYGTGLDNQRAVTVRSTFLQNRDHLDFYYREAYTVVEMEAGPYCAAVHELSDADRHPVGEAVSLARLPLDFGVIHYASDTPYTQARTLGARGLSFFGMDATYAGALAIMRRILRLEGALPEPPRRRAGLA